MAKYDPLRDALVRVGSQCISMTFADIEALVGPLPSVAWNYPWWWDNKDAQAPHYVQCRAWGAAGYCAGVDLKRRMVVFTRKG